MLKLMKIVAVVGLAAISCGFGYLDRPQAVSEAIAMFGPPIEIAHLDGELVYYWNASEFGHVCKIWGAARQGIILHWGYRSCAY
jgi:hypothetical protein